MNYCNLEIISKINLNVALILHRTMKQKAETFIFKFIFRYYIELNIPSHCKCNLP